MTASDSADEEILFEEAICLDSPIERAHLLEFRCGNNFELRQRIEQLLAGYSKSDHLENPPIELANSGTLPEGFPTSNLQGQVVGKFEVLEMIGEGGMGDVYLARSLTDNASVAIKVIKPGLDTRQVIVRFELERATLQRMDHANIARYIDAGVTDFGRAYFAMELIRGLPITEYCDRNRLKLCERLKLFMDVCIAVNHASQQGIVHRDLKPNNILVTQINKMPIVKIIDFGVAKALIPDTNLVTRFTVAIQWLGTPNYMSPEQARFSSDVDVRSDVYSLGVLLYELITGSTPLPKSSLFDGDLDDIRSRIIDEEVVRPSHQLASLDSIEMTAICKSRSVEPGAYRIQVRGDLDWIVLKSLEKDRVNRYSDPGKLAEDIRASLDHRPVTAHRPSIVVRVLKLAVRQRAVLSIAGAIGMISLIMFGLIQLRVSHQANKEKIQLAIDARVEMETELTHRDFVLDFQKAESQRRVGELQPSKQLLEKYASDPVHANHFAIGYLRLQMLDPVQSISGFSHNPLDMDLSSDGQWIATGDRGGDIRIIELKSGIDLLRLHPSDKEVTRLRFSPDGNWLATASQDRVVRIWSAKDWSKVIDLAQHEHTINGLAWSNDSHHLASGDRDGVVCIWDVGAQKCNRQLSPNAGAVRCMAWSSDGKKLVIGNGDDGIHIWDTNTWERTEIANTIGKGALAIAISNDNRYMAFGGYSGELVFVNLADSTVLQRTTSANQVWSLTFGVHNELIAGEGNGILEVFQIEGQQWDSCRRLLVAGPKSAQRSVVFNKEHNQFAVLSEEDRNIQLFTTLAILGYESYNLDSSPIGILPGFGILSSPNDGKNASVRQTVNDPIPATLPISLSPYCPPEFCQTRNLVALSNETADGCYVYLFRPGIWAGVSRFTFPRRIRSLSFSRNGRQLIAAGGEGNVRISDLDANESRDLTLGADNVTATFSPTQDLLVIGLTGTTRLSLLESESLRELRSVNTGYPWLCIKYHPDGKCLFVGEVGRMSVWSGDLSEVLWATPFNQLKTRFVKCVCLSPDQRTIAFISDDGLVQFWDLQTRSKLFEVSLPPVRCEHCWLCFADSANLFMGNSASSSLFRLRAAEVSLPSHSK